MSNEAADLTYVNFGGLAAGEENLQKLHDRLVASLQDLETTLRRELVNWKGGAEAAYGDQRDIWNKSAADMQDILNALRQGVGTANEAFQQAERDNVRLWSNHG